MHRRAFLTASTLTIAAGWGVGASAQTQAEQEGPFGATGAPFAVPPSDLLPLGPLSFHFPDPHVETLDKRFPGAPGNAAVERVATGFRWVEGPAYFRAGGYLLFSDIPNNRIMRLLGEDNHLSVFRAPSLNTNGNTVDRQGRLVSCEHTARRITRTEFDGTITVIAERYQGKPFNAPNDVVTASDGSIWFSDPIYGTSGFYEGLKAQPEQRTHNVYRVDPHNGKVSVVVDDFVEPNGLCFSPDEKTLYIIDSGITQGGPSHIRAFDVNVKTGAVSGDRVFANDFAPGFTDGMRADVDGNIWCGMGWGDPKEDGVRCYSPGGELLGKIHLPQGCSNVVFGGPLRNRLYMCGSTSVYALYVNTQGAALP